MRVSLPEDIAAELIDDRLAVRPIATRGGPLAETVAVGIGSLEMVAAVVTIALETPTLHRIIAGALRREREADAEQVTFSITRAGETRTLTLDSGDPEAEERAFDFLIAGFEVKR